MRSTLNENSAEIMRILVLLALLSIVFAFRVPHRAQSRRIGTVSSTSISPRQSATLLMAKSKKGGGGGGGSSKEKAPKKSKGGGDDGEFEWKSYRASVTEKMQTSIDAIQGQLNTLRASGANPAMLDRVFVEYFGSLTPLNQVASVGTNGPNQLTIDPFDKTILGEIEKAISMSDLNLNPQNDGTGLIRINVPQLTEERRKELVKQAKTIAEDGKVAVRNHRRDAVDKVKALEKSSDIGKDDSKGFQDDLQKLTDEFGKKLETMFKSKEEQLTKV